MKFNLQMKGDDWKLKLTEIQSSELTVSQGWSYLAEQFRQIKCSLEEQFRQIKRSLAEQFHQIKRSLAEQFRKIKRSLEEQ